MGSLTSTPGATTRKNNNYRDSRELRTDNNTHNSRSPFPAGNES